MEVRVRFIRSKTELLEAANLIGKVIKATPYYGPRTKREEIKKYNRRNIPSSGKKFIGAFSGKVLVGVTMVAPDEGTLWVDWRLVEKPYRRKGIATKMFRFTEAFARNNNMHKIWEDTRTNNVPAISLARKLGYKKVAVLKKHWYGEDFYIWEKFI